MAVQIVPSVLRAQVDEGMKLKPLAEHYGLPVAQMKRALQAQGLTIRKFHAPKFEFVTEEQTSEEIVAETLIVDEVDVTAEVAEVAVSAIDETTETVGELEVEVPQTVVPVVSTITESVSDSEW